VDAIGDASNSSVINTEILDDFAVGWSKHDPSGSGLITIDQLCTLLQNTYPPFGYKNVSGYTRRKVMQSIGLFGHIIFISPYCKYIV